jgi:arsenate reductase (glutaredoxin)
MSEAIIYYNPRCGTCQKVLAILEAKKFKVKRIEYLNTPPTVDELDAILQKLNLPPEGLARRKEDVYAEKVEGRTLSRDQWLELFHRHPVLIERPVVVIGDKAIIARPPEKVHEIL